jgi:hypothetical protein
LNITKKKMALVALALILCVGIVSAAVLPYFGQVQMTATVKQAIRLDGKDYTPPITEKADVSGGESFCTYHWLQSQTSVPVSLQFETWGPDLNGITVTYLKSVEYSYSKDFETARGVLHVTVTDDGEWLKWTYTYAATPTHTPKMTVAINYPHGFCITTFDDGTHDGWYYSPDPYSEATTVRFADYSGGTYEDWVETTASGNVLTVAIKKSALPDTFLWHGFANYNGIGVWIEINTNTWVPTGSIALCGEQITSPFTLDPGERLDFYICYKFDPLIEEGTYDIYTTVKPAS